MTSDAQSIRLISCIDIPLSDTQSIGSTYIIQVNDLESNTIINEQTIDFLSIIDIYSNQQVFDEKTENFSSTNTNSKNR
jgi:hypothetical protein